MISRVAPTIASGCAAALDCGRNISCCRSGFTCSLDHQRKLFAVRANNGASHSAVSALIAGWNPSAIVRFVISVVVSTLYRQVVAITIGSSPIAEWLKRMPLCANSDAAAAITREAFDVRIATSVEHASPDAVQPRWISTWRSAMNCVCLLAHLYHQATTRFCLAASQFMPVHHSFIATCTATTPKRCFAPAANAFDRCQAIECLTGNIDDGFGHSDLSTRLLRQVTGWRFNAGPLRILTSVSA